MLSAPFPVRAARWSAPTDGRARSPSAPPLLVFSLPNKNAHRKQPDDASRKRGQRQQANPHQPASDRLYGFKYIHRRTPLVYHNFAQRTYENRFRVSAPWCRRLSQTDEKLRVLSGIGRIDLDIANAALDDPQPIPLRLEVATINGQSA